VEQTLQSSSELAGHKQVVEFQVEGQVLNFHFAFHSPDVPAASHPFITAAEISLIRDRNEAPPGGAEKKVLAQAIDGVDGKSLKINKKVSNGYKKGAWKLESNADISFFRGSTLVASRQMPSGKLKAEVPMGSYSCMIRHVKFYTAFIEDCHVTNKGLTLGDVALSPVLNPGDTRIVLTWGATPKDLDSYLTVPHSDPAKPDCVINYKNKVCNKKKMTETRLDLDATSHSKRGGKPETITLGLKTPGKYVFRVSEYGGKNSDGLLHSGAIVTYYAESEVQKYVAGRDGYITGINWCVVCGWKRSL